jgi:hypothetical protein
MRIGSGTDKRSGYGVKTRSGYEDKPRSGYGDKTRIIKIFFMYFLTYCFKIAYFLDIFF